MKRATYREIPRLISRREPFTGNSASAQWNSSGVYEVRSYRTVIATYTPGTGWNVPEEYYSRTTSRLQNLVRSVA